VERIDLIAAADEKARARAIARAAEVLRGGGIALLAAEGVYGFHASAARGDAVVRLYRLKERDPSKGFIGLLANPDDAVRWARPSPLAVELAREHWPGALTLVLPAREDAPAPPRTEEGTIALRCPGAPLLRAIVQAVGELVLSTSANPPGEAPLTSAEGPIAGRADLVIDEGKRSGIPSTVAVVQEDQVRIVRPGSVRLAGRST